MAKLFPIHLFAAPESKGWILAIGEDGAAMDVRPVNEPGERRVVIVREDGGGIRSSGTDGRALEVVAGPNRFLSGTPSLGRSWRTAAMRKGSSSASSPVAVG